MAAIQSPRAKRASLKRATSTPRKKTKVSKPKAAKPKRKGSTGKARGPKIKEAVPKVKRGAKKVAKPAVALRQAGKSDKKITKRGPKTKRPRPTNKARPSPTEPIEVIEANGNGKGRIPAVVIKPLLPSLMTLDQVAEMLGVSKVTVRRWTTKKILSCVRIGSRKDRRFRRTEVEKWLRSCMEKAEPVV
jgi:excisionase family DNA binding protein